MELSNPTTSTQAVLYHLIKHRKVSIMDFGYLSGFRTRISEFNLNYNLDLTKNQKNAIDQYNISYYYIEHILQECNVEKAIKVYNKLKQ